MNTRVGDEDWAPSGLPGVSRIVIESADDVQAVDASLQDRVDGCRRAHPRVAGPFDGRRVGALETPIQLFDLSLGGCFVNSLHEQQLGVKLVLKIELPGEGWITLKAMTLYRRGAIRVPRKILWKSERRGVPVAKGPPALHAHQPPT